VNTYRLIDLLSSNLEPVSQTALERALGLTVAVGGAAAFATMLATVGPRPDASSLSHVEWSAVKLLFALSVVGAATPALIRSARPQPGVARRLPMVFLPFVVVGIAAVPALLAGPAHMEREMLGGAYAASPTRCLLCIAGFAAIPLVALIRALRDSAPAQPRLCGAMAGVVSGGVGAAAYAFACVRDSMPFIAVWYGVAIALYALLGVLIAQRLLRW
jgi:hypothetical protein